MVVSLDWGKQVVVGGGEGCREVGLGGRSLVLLFYLLGFNAVLCIERQWRA